MAKLIDVDQSTISKIENNTLALTENLAAKIALALNIEIDDIYRASH